MFLSVTVLLFVSGIWLGTKIDITELQKSSNYSSNIKKTIAVVNQDLGVNNGDKITNYSEAFISSLNEDYKVVSYKEAQEGLSRGDFSAIVTFPSSLSSEVYSINQSNLQSPKIEFTVNSSLTESAYIETYLKILDLQNEMNKTVSYLYVASIFDEFHSGQDQVKKLFENDTDDMNALKSVQLHDFRLSLNWSDIPQVDFNPKEIDFNEFVSEVQGYADDMSEKYVDSYTLAQTDYSAFQSEFSALSQNISASGMKWYEDVNKREQKVTEHVSDVKKYTDVFLPWSESVSTYNQATKDWKNSLDNHLIKINDWRNLIFSWKTDMDAWGAKYKEELDTYLSSVDAYNSSVEDYLNLISDISVTWSDEYERYFSETETWKSLMDTTVNEYKRALPILNTYIDLAEQYSNSISDYSDSLTEFHGAIYTNLYNNYFFGLNWYRASIQTGYFGDDNSEGIKGYIDDYYTAVKNYESSVDNYKTAVTQYAENYKNQLNDYYLSNDHEAEMPVFNLEDIGNTSDSGGNEDTPEEFDFDAIKESIDGKIVFLENSNAANADNLDNAKSYLQELLNSYSSLISGQPAEPDYPVLPSEDELTQIDNEILNSYIPADLVAWSDACTAEKPIKSDYIIYDISNSQSMLPADTANFEESDPDFLGGDLPEFSEKFPDKLDDALPEVPNDLISGCNTIVDESQKYVPQNYLNDETKAQVDEVVGRYSANLDTVDARLLNNMSSNNNLLTSAYNDYNAYVTLLYSDASKAYITEQDDLLKTLDGFYEVKNSTSLENKSLMEDFTLKMPYSRKNSITNKETVSFTTSPLKFVSGSIRTNDQLGVSLQEKRLDVYYVFILIALILVVITVLVILILYWKDASRIERNQLY